MKYFLHENDLPDSVPIGQSVAIDTETMGLNLIRDRLCLIQICFGNEEAHLVRINSSKKPAPLITALIIQSGIH